MLIQVACDWLDSLDDDIKRTHMNIGRIHLRNGSFNPPFYVSEMLRKFFARNNGRMKLWILWRECFIAVCTVWCGLSVSCIFTRLRKCTMISQQWLLQHPFYGHVSHCPVT